jgi:hypothetical protein
VPTRSSTSSSPPPPRRGGLRLGESSVEPAADSNPRGTAEAFQYVARNSFTTATVNLYVDSPNTAAAGRLGIYTNGKNGNPYELLGQVKFAPVPGWNRIALPGVQVTVGRRYWLAELGTRGTLAFRDRHNDTPESQTKSVGSILPARWSTGGTHWNTGRASFYVAGSTR